MLAIFLSSPVLGFAEVRKEYYPSGRLKFERNFKDGKQEGIAKEYYESGKLKAEGSFEDGKQEGISKEYYENGGIKFIDNYKNGQVINRKAYDEKGNLEFEQDYTYKE